MRDRVKRIMAAEDFPYLPSGLAEVNKMIQEYGDLFSDSQCKVCNAVLISESQKLAHYQSKKHANKVRRYLSTQNEMEPTLKKLKTPSSDSDCNNGDTDRFKVCHVCNMTFSSSVMAQSHYQGKVHTKNLRLKTVGPPIPAQVKKKSAGESSSAVSIGTVVSGNDDPNRGCSICQASFNNPLMAQQHYVGKKHKKQMTKLKLIETYGPSITPASNVKGYSCTYCNIDLNSVTQYQFHISGARHKNQMKKSCLSTAENQHAAERNQCTAGDNRYAAEDDQCAAGDDRFTTGDDQCAPGGNQCATGYAEYSEYHQYT